VSEMNGKLKEIFRGEVVNKVLTAALPRKRCEGKISRIEAVKPSGAKSRFSTRSSSKLSICLSSGSAKCLS